MCSSGLKILAPQAVEHAAPELRVAADVVVRVRPELVPALVEPALAGLIAQMLPDRLRTPVLVFLRDEVAALENQDARGAVRQRVGHGPAARAAADDDDVVAFGPHQAVGWHARVDVIHQPLVFDRALEAHLGRARVP